jgi:hypothetical protein
MAKNVITYAVQDLFVGAPMVMPNEHETVGSNNVFSRQNDWSLTGYTGQLSNGSPDGQSFEVLQRLNKIQDFKYSIDLPKSNINSVGSITSLDSYVTGPPSVSIDFSYYVDGINNEHRMGFSTQNQVANLPISFVSGMCQKETDRKNIYLAIDSQGTEMSIRDQDADGYPSRPLGHPFVPVTGILDTGAPSYNFLIFMNSYINRYSINMGVGQIPTVNVGAVADNVFFTTGVDTGFGIPYINTENAVTGFSGVSVVVPKNFINNVNTFDYPESVFLPSQIKLTLSRRGADIISFQNETVQGCNIDLDLTRESVQYMGHRLPWDRPLATPIGIKADFDLLVSGSLTGNLMEDLVYNDEYDINVDFVTGGIVGMNYQLSGLRLNSTQYDSSIGSNKTASLSFSTDFDLNDNSSEMPTSKGFFVSGRVIQVKDRFIYSGLSGVSDTTIFLRTGATAGLGSIQDDKDSTLYPRY